MTNLDSTFKSKDITFLAKVCMVKAMFFLIVMCGCDSGTIKKAEHWRLLRVPWIARRSNQSILKEINPEYSLEGLILKLKLQNLVTWWEVLTLMMWKIEGKRRMRHRKRWLDSITNSMDMNLSKFLQIVKDREAPHAAVHRVAKSWTQLSNWTTTIL